MGMAQASDSGRVYLWKLLHDVEGARGVIGHLSHDRSLRLCTEEFVGRVIEGVGVAGLASASIGIFDSHTMMPVALILCATSFIGLGILIFGKRHIPRVQFVEEKGAHFLPH